jgi:hypothetical protein
MLGGWDHAVNIPVAYKNVVPCIYYDIDKEKWFSYKKGTQKCFEMWRR